MFLISYRALFIYILNYKLIDYQPFSHQQSWAESSATSAEINQLVRRFIKENKTLHQND